MIWPGGISGMSMQRATALPYHFCTASITNNLTRTRIHPTVRQGMLFQHKVLSNTHDEKLESPSWRTGFAPVGDPWWRILDHA